ncbi:MAG: GIY-YIG nuclease family protein, partial [Candidatus Omnitrophota bacterium]
MSCVYVLKSLKDEKLYIGSTRKTVEERVKVHNKGSVRSTKGRRPLKLIYSESFDNYADACKREKYFKTG